MKKILLGFVGLVVLALLGAVVYWYTMDIDKLKNQLTAYASQKLGRTLTISGELSPSFSLTSGFSITVKGVSLANAKGFQPQNMVSLNELQLVVNPFGIFNKQIEISTLVIDNADVYLEQRGSQNNWTFANTAGTPAAATHDAQGNSAAMAIGINSVVGKNLSLTKITDGQKKVYKITEVELQAALNKPVSLTMAAEADGKPLTLALLGGSLAEIQGGEKQKIDVTFDFAPHHITLQGSYRRSGDTHHLTNTVLTYNDIKATGDIALNLAGTVPDVVLDIVVPSLDMAKLQSEGSGAGEPKPSDYAKSDQVFSRDLLPWSTLRAANVNAKLSVKQLLNDSQNMGPADIQARLQNGVLVSTVIMQPPGAKKPIILKTNASAAKQVSVALSAPSMEPTLLLGENPLLQAPANLMLEITGSGNSLHDIAASANGRFVLEFLPGTLNAGALPLAAKGALASVVGLDQIDGARLACTKIDFGIVNGVATAQGIGVDSAPLVMAGDGAVNLGAETLNLRLVAEPQVAVARGARFPIYIKGTLGAPTTMVDTAAITGQIANAAAGKAIKLIGNESVAGIADAFLGKSKDAAANDYAKMPFNPCRPNAVEPVAVPTAQPVAPAANPQQQIEQIIRDPKKILENPEQLLKGFLGQ